MDSAQVGFLTTKYEKVIFNIIPTANQNTKLHLTS